ncbi:MAG: DUF4351 domain-containing protein [Desulfococcaceae bacterium]
MTTIDHDHNFKNLFQDFPKEALEWILPEVLETYGPVREIEFLRQEPRKRQLADGHLVLDMPILFRFDDAEIILWLVEFQEDKKRFSIYKLLRYTTDMAEEHPEALVIPTVLFTDRKNWRKGVPEEIDHRFNNRTFLHFEYVLFRLFDANAKDHYDSDNPLVRILLPKMRYPKEERGEVFRRALIGLFQLASLPMSEKYAPFIDTYANVPEQERKEILQDLAEKEEVPMISTIDYFEERGVQKGIHKGESRILSRMMAKKFGISPEMAQSSVENLSSEALEELSDRILDWNSFEEVQRWIEQREPDSSSRP